MNNESHVSILADPLQMRLTTREGSINVSESADALTLEQHFGQPRRHDDLFIWDSLGLSALESPHKPGEIRIIYVNLEKQVPQSREEVPSVAAAGYPGSFAICGERPAPAESVDAFCSRVVLSRIGRVRWMVHWDCDYTAITTSRRGMWFSVYVLRRAPPVMLRLIRWRRTGNVFDPSPFDFWQLSLLIRPTLSDWREAISRSLVAEHHPIPERPRNNDASSTKPADPNDKMKEPNSMIRWTGHPSHWNYFLGWLLGLATLPFGVGVLIILAVLLVRARQTFRMTGERVVSEPGLIIKSSSEIMIDDVRSLNVIKTGIRGFMGIGSIEFASAATERAEVTFRNIANVDTVAQLFRELQRRRKQQ